MKLWWSTESGGSSSSSSSASDVNHPGAVVQRIDGGIPRHHQHELAKEQKKSKRGARRGEEESSSSSSDENAPLRRKGGKERKGKYSKGALMLALAQFIKDLATAQASGKSGARETARLLALASSPCRSLCMRPSIPWTRARLSWLWSRSSRRASSLLWCPRSWPPWIRRVPLLTWWTLQRWVAYVVDDGL